jgi:hypothetical protein
MSFHAANPAGFSHLSPSSVERANKSLPTCNGGGEWHPSYGGHACSNRTAMAVDFFRRDADENFALECVCRFVSRFCSGTASGLFLRPAAARSSASPLAPLRGLGSSQNKFANHGTKRRGNFFRAPPRKQTFGTWEPGPLAWVRPV